jgi:hypothetical protein
MNAHRRIAHGLKGLDTDFLKSFRLSFISSYIFEICQVLYTKKPAYTLGIGGLFVVYTLNIIKRGHH